MEELDRTVEALLFLSAEPLNSQALAAACERDVLDIEASIERLKSCYVEGECGIVLRELAGGVTFASSPSAEPAARRLLSKPSFQNLSQAQLECLAIAAYIGPVSRPEIARIRGVSSESAVANLVDRGLLMEAGRSRFGAVRYRTTDLFQKVFGLKSLAELPQLDEFESSDEDRAKLRERLLKAGEARLN